MSLVSIPLLRGRRLCWALRSFLPPSVSPSSNFVLVTPVSLELCARMSTDDRSLLSNSLSYSTMQFFRNPNITISQESTFVFILSAGTFFGTLITALFSDYLGQWPGLIIACWVFNLGVILQTIATAIPTFIAGRFFAGIGVGMVSAMSMLSYPIILSSGD